jgi:hypothetical protein
VFVILIKTDNSALLLSSTAVTDRYTFHGRTTIIHPTKVRSRNTQMALKRSLDETNEVAQMPVSPQSNSSSSPGDNTVLKVDSPSEKQIAELIASENAIMDSADDLEMDDEEAVEDEDLGRPYKRICRGRESALSLAMTDQIKQR